MAIQFTEAARQRMHEYLARDPGALGVRFGIKRTGCSGFGYTVDLTDAIAADDRVFEEDGMRLVVDAKSLPFVDGTEIDFQRRGINATFVFRNPNATGECGCGESFTVDRMAEDAGPRVDL
ncbi:MAG TPA: iron-sulfur cluster assembly accessory protein [Rhodanobacteraceae bacterium]|nr:iron-sulfur cluster assembly accessory protein [Rhodanobacteraceae bacterium]